MPELLSGTGNVDDALRDLYTLRGAATTDAIAADPFAADRDRLIGHFADSEHHLARTLAAMRQMVAILLGELQAQTLSNKRQAASYRRLHDDVRILRDERDALLRGLAR